jgi:hypothetical protein
LIKRYLEKSGGGSINAIATTDLSVEFQAGLKTSWNKIVGDFRAYECEAYANLCRQFLVRKVDKKLSRTRNALFRETIVPGRPNFLHLFITTAGLYNPFLSDPYIAELVSNSMFSPSGGGTPMFTRTWGNSSLHGMTVNDFCRSIGIARKVGFDTYTAILFLAGLVMPAEVHSIAIPSQATTVYLSVTFDSQSGRPTSVAPSLVEPELSENIRIQRLTSLQWFTTMYQASLGGAGAIDAEDLYSLLSSVVLERRS